MIWLEEPFKSLWMDRDPFLEISVISAGAPNGQIYRNKEGRRTLRFQHDNHSYFLKYHHGVGWREIIKNLLQLRPPILGARPEFDAARKLRELGIDTLTPLAYGCRGVNPARQESFLVTADLVNTISLEDYCKDWKASTPDFRVKQALIKRVGETARALHEHGINHRDFYLCHFLLEKNAQQKIQEGSAFRCYLIDLHRCTIRTKVPYRWLVKDIGGLWYSAMDAGLSTRDCYRFIKHYTGQSLRREINRSFWRDVIKNAEKLYRKDFGRAPQAAFSLSADRHG